MAANREPSFGMGETLPVGIRLLISKIAGALIMKDSCLNHRNHFRNVIWSELVEHMIMTSASEQATAIVHTYYMQLLATLNNY